LKMSPGGYANFIFHRNRDTTKRQAASFIVSGVGLVLIRDASLSSHQTEPGADGGLIMVARTRPTVSTIAVVHEKPTT